MTTKSTTMNNADLPVHAHLNAAGQAIPALQPVTIRTRPRYRFRRLGSRLRRIRLGADERVPMLFNNYC